MSRLTEEQRRAILAPNAVAYSQHHGGIWIDAGGPFEVTLEREEVLRALRLTARLDALGDRQRERILEQLARLEADSHRAAERRAVDSPELAEAHESTSEACFILQEVLHG